MDSLSPTHLPPCLELNDETQIQVFKSTQTKSAIFWRFRYLCTIAHAMMNQGKYFQRILMHNVIPRWKLAHFEIRFCYKTLCLPTSPHFQWHFLKVCNLQSSTQGKQELSWYIQKTYGKFLVWCFLNWNGWNAMVLIQSAAASFCLKPDTFLPGLRNKEPWRWADCPDYINNYPDYLNNASSCPISAQCAPAQIK